jgi:hypothetical protein
MHYSVEVAESSTNKQHHLSRESPTTGALGGCSSTAQVIFGVRDVGVVNGKRSWRLQRLGGCQGECPLGRQMSAEWSALREGCPGTMK